MKHTKGPWKIVKSLDDSESTQIFAPINSENIYPSIAIITCNLLSEDEENANTNLIAAAPDMFELLEFLTNLHNSGDLHDRIVNVVNKAKGIK